MRFKGVLKGITQDGQLATWTGLPVGFGTPLILAQVFKTQLQGQMVDVVAKAAGSISSGGDLIGDNMGNVGDFLNKAKLYKYITLGAPFALALPLLAFKTTRKAALGIIGGGIVGDLAYLYWPTKDASASGTATQTTTTADKPTEGGIVARTLRGAPAPVKILKGAGAPVRILRGANVRVL